MKKTSVDVDEMMNKLSKYGKGMDKLFNGEERQLVLEVGPQFINMVEYVVKPNSIEVLDGFVINTPNGSIKKDRLVDLDALYKVINQSITRTNIKSKEFMVSITSREIITREMFTQKMTGQDLMKYVRFNSDDIFPVDLNEYVLGYNVNEKGEKSKLMIAASPKDIISSYISLGQKLGLQLKHQTQNSRNYKVHILNN